MKKRISKTILLTTIIAIICVFAVSTLVFSLQIYDANKQKVRESAIELKNALDSDPNYDTETLKLSSFRITIIQQDGTVLFDNRYDPELDNHLDRPEISSAIKNGYGESLRNSTTFKTNMYYYAILLNNGNILRIAESSISFLGIITNSIVYIIIIGSIIIGICYFIVNKETNNIVEPINNLNLEEPLANKTYPELDPLLVNIEMHNQLRKEFSANVSHELKTPLTSISGYAEIMANGIAKEEDQKNFSKKIYDESQNLIEKINDIIKISKLDEHRIEEKYEKCNYRILLGNIIKRLETMAKDKNVTLSLSSDDVYGECIISVVEDLFYNLIQNGIKYNKDNGHVYVEVDKSNKQIIVTIKDDGIGIKKDDLPRIYERFFRADKSHGQTIEGSGLGLAIVKHAVIMHNGTITCKSEYGKGTTFTVSLPIEKA